MWPEYGKTENLFARDPMTGKIQRGVFRDPAFSAVNRWLVTEKIDGTNVRVGYDPATKTRFINGRTNNAQMPTSLMMFLDAAFPVDRLEAVCGGSRMLIFGEGYGSGIQKGGGRYRSGVSFRSFDIARFVGEEMRFLGWAEVEGISQALGVKTAPMLGVMNTDEAIARTLATSRVAAEDGGDVSLYAEGVIAVSMPTLYDHFGTRVKFKLKARDLVDFGGESQCQTA